MKNHLATTGILIFSITICSIQLCSNKLSILPNLNQNLSLNENHPAICKVVFLVKGFDLFILVSLIILFSELYRTLYQLRKVETLL
jgi:hypothetical protein